MIVMKEHSHRQLPWYSLGPIEKIGSKWFIKDLYVRWNEQIEEKEMDNGPIIEYIYDAHRFNYELPVDIQPGVEAVEYYLSEAEDSVILLAQKLLAQEEGFDGTQ